MPTLLSSEILDKTRLLGKTLANSIPKQTPRSHGKQINNLG